MTGYANSHIFFVLFVWFPLKRDWSKTAAEEGRAGITSSPRPSSNRGSGLDRMRISNRAYWRNVPTAVWCYKLTARRIEQIFQLVAYK